MTTLADVGPAGRDLTVDRDGTRLHALDFGEQGARVVVAVHGFASSAQANWVASGWVRTLVKEGYRVVALDQRGHGDSAKPHDAACYSMQALVDDVAALIADLGAGENIAGGESPRAGMPAADLLGYSLGARVCAEFAVQHPDVVRTLSLGGIDDQELFSHFDAAAARDYVISSTPIADDTTAALVGVMQALPGSDREALLALAEGVGAGSARAASSRATGAGADAAGAGPATPLPSAPTVVACGENDAVAAHGAEYAAALPNAQFVPLKGRTHANAVTSRAFKTAVTELLAAH